MGGSWSKWLLMMGAADAGELAMIAVLMISSLLSVAYLLPVVAKGFFGPVSSAPEETRFREAPWTCVAPLSITAGLCVLLFFLADPIVDFLAPVGATLSR